jgi:hypothetical protein
MAGFETLISGLRRAEQQLEKQLHGIRTAISSLEFGGAVSPAIPGGKRRGRPAGSRNTSARQGIIIIGGRKKRTMSAKARKAISDAQKARWAKQKAAEKKK